MVSPNRAYTTPPMPQIQPAMPAVNKLVDAARRAANAVSRADLIDALNSVQYWTNEAHQKAGTGINLIAESPRPHGGLLA